jgi:5-methylcytosine-specific restriction endonuclease McrA
MPDNRDRKAYFAEYRAKNAASIAEKRRVYYETHRALIAERHKVYDQKNRVRKLAYYREYNGKRREELRKYGREYRSANKAKLKERRQSRREIILLRHAQWARSHPESILTKNRNRKARLRNLPGKHGRLDIQAIWERQGHRCAVPGCQYPISDRKGKDKYHVDHIQPISRGGSNGPENLQILCGFHNTSKLDQDYQDWLTKMAHAEA